MYKILTSVTYRKSYKRLKHSGRSKDIKQLDLVLSVLKTKGTLDRTYEDHSLTGNMSNYRECHVRGDLLLVYQKHDNIFVLTLVDVGTHHEIFGT